MEKKQPATVEKLVANAAASAGVSASPDVVKMTATVLKNLASLTGQDLVAAEQQARAAGDMSPMVKLSMQYQASLAAKALGMKLDDVMDLPAPVFSKLTDVVATFLFK